MGPAVSKWTFVDISVLWDKNVLAKEDEKINNYSPLAREIRNLYRVSTKVIPSVKGCLGVVSSRIEGTLTI